VVGACERSNETPGNIKCGEFVDYLGRVSFSGKILLHVVSYMQ
jgi:hypothetical protein